MRHYFYEKRETKSFDFSKTYEKVCTNCGGNFVSHTHNAKFCKECRKIQKKGVKKNG